MLRDLEGILRATLSVDDFYDLDALKTMPEVEPPDLHDLEEEEQPPALEAFMPKQSTFQKLLPGAKRRYAEAMADAHKEYNIDVEAHTHREIKRLERLEAARLAYHQHVATARENADRKNSEIDRFKQDLAKGMPQAITDYFTLVLQSSIYPDGFPQHARLAYVPESRQLVVEYDMPPYEVVPSVSSYKYIKARDEITATNRPTAQRKALYSSVIAQVALRTIHELFEADRIGNLETVALNGYIESIDKATGRAVRPCIVTI